MRRTLAIVAALVVGGATCAATPVPARAHAAGASACQLGKNIGYVANFVDDNVEKVDLSTNKVISTIHGFSSPWAAELNPEGSLLYVDSIASPNNTKQNEIDVMDTCTNAIVKKIPTIGPGYEQASPDHKWLYAPNLDADGLQMINTETATVVRTFVTTPGTQGGVSNDQKTLWALGMPNLIYTINMATGLPDGPPFDLGGIAPLQATMSQDGSKLAVADFADRVAMVDTQPGSPHYRSVTQVFNTGLGSQPGISAFSPDGRYLWVGGYSGQISVLDLKSSTFTCWNLDANAFGTTVSADGKRVYITTTPTGSVPPVAGFGVLGLEILKLQHPGGVVRVYDAQSVYHNMPFGKAANCNAQTISNGPQVGQIPAGNVPIALATLDSAAFAPRSGTNSGGR